MSRSAAALGCGRATLLLCSVRSWRPAVFLSLRHGGGSDWTSADQTWGCRQLLEGARKPGQPTGTTQPSILFLPMSSSPESCLAVSFPTRNGILSRALLVLELVPLEHIEAHYLLLKNDATLLEFWLVFREGDLELAAVGALAVHLHAKAPGSGLASEVKNTNSIPLLAALLTGPQ
ncbi:hypothetical protein BDV95DRAFT_591431 [Massariosphaeria phaeospora]|uniref:Uncharacterized protein n=1 Tax=Massariosphaeria phaeospora TaxID=100035 RepID=A0A7C8IC88_9PLEO|nr:hypothetical protein BDV95DRAFT_591431 [Massariosphaeria phaeospora]